MLHYLKKSDTLLKTFISVNQISQWDLLQNHIMPVALKRNVYPLSWSTLNKYVHGKIDYRIEFMRQIKEGMSSYLKRKVKMEELFVLDWDYIDNLIKLVNNDNLNEHIFD